MITFSGAKANVKCVTQQSALLTIECDASLRYILLRFIKYVVQAANTEMSVHFNKDAATNLFP